MIIYKETLDGITAERLNGFFVGWPNPPVPETLLKILEGSYAVVLACEQDSGKVVGFINAISDGVLSAYVPLLEVLPENQKQGIGAELTARMVKKLHDLYMVDIVCDRNLESFYTKAGFSPLFAMIRRNYDAQSGKK